MSERVAGARAKIEVVCFFEEYETSIGMVRRNNSLLGTPAFNCMKIVTKSSASLVVTRHYPFLPATRTCANSQTRMMSDIKEYLIFSRDGRGIWENHENTRHQT